jgi:small subunit ribosomal protein S16
MLMIRLQRIGKKKQAHFRVVSLEHTKKPQGEYQELLGTYDPHAKKLEIDRERVEKLMSQGAQISPTVNNLMVNFKIWDRPKMESWKPKKKKEAAK